MKIVTLGHSSNVLAERLARMRPGIRLTQEEPCRLTLSVISGVAEIDVTDPVLFPPPGHTNRSSCDLRERL